MPTPPGPANITDAYSPKSVEMSQRVRRYAVTMAFRTACFLAAVIFAHGWLQWVLFAGAVFLPYVAVLLANQANQKGQRRTVQRGAPADARQLPARPSTDFVEGEVVADPEGGLHDDAWGSRNRRDWVA